MLPTNNFYTLSDSPIHGKGVFAKKKLAKDADIDIGIEFYFGFFPVVTDHFGKWLNHSYQPNIYLDYHDGAWYLKALRQIEIGEELVMNYNNTPWYILKARSDFV